MNFKAFFNTVSTQAYSLPIVILYVTEGCNLQCITCSYRRPVDGELTLEEIGQLAQSLKEFGLRHIVFSGGEPFMRRDFLEICRLFKGLHVKQTLLTNGLLLEKRLEEFEAFFEEIVVSIDGANQQTHDTIRGIASFNQIVKGVKVATQRGFNVSLRSVIQKRNFREIMEIVELAKSLGMSRVSFLAADVLSESFGRLTNGPVASNEAIILDENEVSEFRDIIGRMVLAYRNDIERRFVSESSEKLFHLVHYFEALVNPTGFPKNYCNAPMVSAVITSAGDVQPCYFLPVYGNIRQGSFSDLVKSSKIRAIRKEVRDYTLQRCQTCVCTLHVPPLTALADHF